MLTRCAHCGRFCRRNGAHRPATGDLFGSALAAAGRRERIEQNVRALFPYRLLPRERPAVVEVGAA